MEYRKNKYGEPISLLGYGCMRFTRRGNSIDIDKAERELLRAFELGVNYYDTAYLYPGSEAALGEIVSRNGIRDKINIATKLPQYLVNNPGAIDKYFDEELKRLKTDHVDYYLMHMLTDLAQWEKLKRLGIEDWIERKKASGAIRNIGFSFHGNTEMFLSILKDYPWDFCQIQYNYMDETSQAGRLGLETAYEMGIPVIIMEPLRGGALATKLPQDAVDRIARIGLKPPAIGLKWLYDQPGVTCVLSGMNSIEMVEENCLAASSSPAGSMTPEERETIEDVKRILTSRLKVGCTGCRYCMPCPQGVDIPGIFSCYNTMYLEKKSRGRYNYLSTIGLRKKPGFGSNCIGCKKCEKHCPQSLPVSSLVKEADKALRPLPYKIAAVVGRKFMVR